MSELSYSSGTSTEPLLGITIAEHIKRTAANNPESLALVDRHSNRRWTYSDFDHDTDALAVGLLERGVKKGDRVGIWAQNVGEWALVQYATAKIGAILVNVNPAYRSQNSSSSSNSPDAPAHLADRGASALGLPPIATEVAAKVSSLDLVFLDTVSEDLIGGVAVGERDPSPTSSGRARDARRTRVRSTRSGCSRSSTTSADDPINIQYTSGTTGFPKGVTLSHHNILNNGFFIGEMLSYTPDDTVVVPVPYYHCFGMVIGNLAALSHGSAVVLPAPGFDPVATMAAVTEEKATSLYGVPTMFIAELEHPRFSEFDFSTLRTGVMAGSPCPVNTMRRVIDDMNMSEVAICYGMTETAPVSMMTRVDDSLQKRTETVGRVMPHLNKIADPVTGRPFRAARRANFAPRIRRHARLLGSAR